MRGLVCVSIVFAACNAHDRVFPIAAVHDTAAVGPAAAAEAEALSYEMSVRREEGAFAEHAASLEKYLAENPSAPARPLLRLWIADDKKLAEDSAAEAAYLRIVDEDPSATFFGKSLAAHALDQLAGLAVAKGEPGRAAAYLQAREDRFTAAADRKDLATKRARYHGLAGETALAKAALTEAAAQGSNAAKRMLSYEAIAVAKKPALVTALADALAQRNTKAVLARLPSELWSLGVPGAERVYVSAAVLRPHLIRAIDGATTITLVDDEKDARQTKSYVRVTGLAGDVLTRDVSFVIVESAFGYVVEGLLLHADGNSGAALAAIAALVPPAGALPATPPPARDGPGRRTEDVGFKAPWPAGMSIRAGNISIYFPGWHPGGFECSLGALPGFYYGVITHTARFGDHFAIDFQHPASNGLPALAAQEGVVVDAQAGNETGNPDWANLVKVRHFANRSDIDFRAVAEGSFDLERADFQTEYWHLKGPGPLAVRVSLGQFVYQGQTLGFVNDSGNSAWDHLHFSIHARAAGWQSVKQTGLDGTSLEENWGDSGRCIRSTNRFSPDGFAERSIDRDGDGVPNWSDNCRYTANPAQADCDHDGAGDACDGNSDNDAMADEFDAYVCNPAWSGDPDGDKVDSNTDNCPWDANRDQADSDADGQGDACDPFTLPAIYEFHWF